METVKLLAKKIDIFMENYFRFLVLVAQIMVGIMVVVITIQVYYRKVLHSSVIFYQEVSRLAIVWFSAVAIAYGVKEKIHISIELLGLVMSPKIKKINNIIIDIFILISGIFLLVYGIELFINRWGNNTLPMLQILADYINKFTSSWRGDTVPELKVWKSWQYVMVPVSSISIIYCSIKSLVAQFIENSSFLQSLGLTPLKGHRNWGELNAGD